MSDHTCAACARYTALNDAEGTCSRYDCTTPAVFRDDWDYCWDSGKKDEEDEE